VTVERPGTRLDLPLPLEVRELTRDWFEAALRTRDPAARVRAVEVVEVLAGSATKVRVRLDHDGSDVPAALCVKAGFDPMLRQVAAAGYANEVAFFQEVGGEVPLAPRCWYAETDPVTGQALVLLDDLVVAQATFGRVTGPFSVEQAAATLDLMASWHAAYWEAPRLPALRRRITGHESLVGIIGVLTAPEHWDTHLGQPKGAPVLGRYRDGGVVLAGMQRLWAIDEAGPHTLLHGDTHRGNMYFLPDGAPAFLDWQTAMVGPWAHDVATFLGAALPVAGRRDAEHQLLRHYLDRLTAHGVEPVPSWDEAWLAYRQHLLHGFLWVLTPEEMQPVEITAENTLRFSAAVDDLDTLGALGL
jgi:hypothetical protein